MGLFFEALGWIGSFYFLFAFYMMTVNKWTTGNRIYHWYNIVGSLLFVATGTYYLAWSVIFINFSWGAIACFGLYNTYRKEKK